MWKLVIALIFVTSMAFADVDLYGNGDLYKETGKGIGKVRGYVMTYETPATKAKREAATLVAIQEKIERDAIIKKEEDRKKKLDSIADEMIKQGTVATDIVTPK